MPKRPDPHPPVPATLRRLLGAALLSILGACANYSGITPSAHVMDATGLGLNNAPATAPAPAPEWWLTLDDPQLVQLIQQAIANSPGLRATQARLALARAQVDQRQTANTPQLELEADATHQLFSATPKDETMQIAKNTKEIINTLGNHAREKIFL